MSQVLISSSFIMEPLRETLDFWAQQIPLSFEIKFSPYNQIFQTLSRASLKDVVVLLIREKDLFRSQGEENLTLFTTHLKSSDSQTFVIYCPDQAEDLWKERLKQEIESISSSYFIDLNEWLNRYQVVEKFDEKTEELAHMPYTPQGYTVLGTLIARILYTLQSPVIKLIGVDCDNTLWDGVLAEEKVTMHRSFQEWLLNLHHQGVAIALFSKNEEEEVRSLFGNHSEMVLPSEAIVAWLINWKNKGENLFHLIRTLNIGQDTVLFLDDNPVECSAVAALNPEVVVVPFITTLFHHIWDIPIFYKGSAVDRERSRMYQQHLEREKCKENANSFRIFIDSLELRVEISSMEDKELERVAQLTQRTNQFNASGRRRKANEIREFLKNSQFSVQSVRVKDRFGDYGLVGAIFLEEIEDLLRVDTLLLSCRVLGRGVEYQMASHIGKRACEKLVCIDYSKTKRNTPVEMFLETLHPLEKKKEGYIFDGQALEKSVFNPDLTLPSEPLVSEIKASEESTKMNRSYFAQLTTSLATAEKIREKIRTKKNGAQDPPTNALESIVVSYMSEALNSEMIGVNDNFFSLGGDSLDVVFLTSRLEEATNKAIDMVHIFEHPTPRTLSQAIEQLSWNSQEETSHIHEGLTSEQLGIWYGMRASLEPSIYHIPLAYRFEGIFNPERFNFCIQQIRNRYAFLHESPLPSDETYFDQLHKISDHTWEWKVRFHHLVSDEQSITIFMQDLSALYNNDKLSFPPEEAYSKKPFSKIPLETLEFWKKELPQHTSPSGPNRKAGHERVFLSTDLRKKIFKACQHQGMTPFTFFLAVFSACYRLFSQEDQFIVGIPFSTRKTPKQFGLFINLLPLKFSFQNLLRFSDLSEFCKTKMTQTFSHRHFPFYRIQEELDVSIHFPVIFNWIRKTDQTPQLNQIAVTRLMVNETLTEFDLCCIIEEETDHYAIHFQYASSVYEDWRIQRLIENFVHTLEKFASEPDSALDTLIPIPVTKIPVHRAKYQSLITLFESIDPNAIAIKTDAILLTYQTLNEHVNQLAYDLIRRGMGHDKGAVVCLVDPVDQIIATLAVIKTGGYFIPVDAKAPLLHRQSIIEDADPHLVIENLPLLENLPKVNPNISILSHQIAYVIYTSGSTGKPKGVMIEHGGLSHRIVHAKEILNISPKSRVLVQASPAFDMHILEWTISLCAGAMLCPFIGDYQRLWNFMYDMQITHATFTPSVLSLLPNVTLPHFKMLCLGGEVAPQSLIDSWCKEVTIVNGYGPAECTIFTHMHILNDTSSPRIIGRPIPGVECTVMDSRGEAVLEGGIGELCVEGIGVMRGYLGSESLKNRQYATGDLVRVLPDGMMEFIGRKNTLVKIHGCRVDVYWVEDKIMSIPGINEAAVVPLHQHEDQCILACFYSGPLNDWKIIRSVLREQLPSYMVPTQYIHVDALPRMSSGKLDRNALKSPLKQIQDNSDHWTEREKELALLWKELLGAYPKYREEDFFQMGGDSLQLVQLIIAIEKKWGIEISTPEILKYSTLFELAQCIGLRTEKRQAVLSIQPHGKRHPLFLVHPAFGLAECYRPLSNHLPEQPLYGIQNPFILNKSFSTLLEMAKHYAKELLKIRSQGPYLLGGWSFGGVVAFEMAVELKKLGKHVDLVILIDSYAPGSSVKSFPFTLIPEELLLESKNNEQLWQEHLLSSYEGKVHLIRSSHSQSSNQGWHLLKHLSISEISIQHQEMFDVEHIPEMAKAIAPILHDISAV